MTDLLSWLRYLVLLLLVVLAVRGIMSIAHDGISPEWLWERPW